MLTADLINNNIPRLQLKDSIAKAIQLINDFRVTHLPVVSDDNYLGLIGEDDLMDAEEEKSTIQILEQHFIAAAVKKTNIF